MPGLSKLRRPGTGRSHRERSDRGGRARSVKTVQTWNGEGPWKALWLGLVCQVCQNCADLERGEATESALAGVGVPGLSKSCRPGTVRGSGKVSSRGGCARSAEKVQTWNGGMPRSGLWHGEEPQRAFCEGQVCQVC